jgi:DNA replication protein
MISVHQWAEWMSRGSTSIPHLLLEHYKKLHISDKEMMLIIHIHSFISEGVRFPSIEEIQDRMTCSKLELSRTLNRLHKERFLDIQSTVDAEGKMVERFSLEPLWEKLFRYLTIGLEDVSVPDMEQEVWPTDNENRSVQEEGEVFKRFEQEFGRPLSPMECETISQWLEKDGMPPAIIFLALKEAVISNKLSLRYIDKILFEWQKKGYKTPEEVHAQSQRFRDKQVSVTESQKEQDDFPFYNWLESRPTK